MQFIVTKQIAVEADTPENAVAAVDKGQTISLNVQLRPQPQTAAQRTPQIIGGMPVAQPRPGNP